LPALIKALSLIFKDKSKKAAKSKIAALQTLTRVCLVLKGGLAPYLKNLVPFVVQGSSCVLFWSFFLSVNEKRMVD